MIDVDIRVDEINDPDYRARHGHNSTILIRNCVGIQWHNGDYSQSDTPVTLFSVLYCNTSFLC